MSLMRYFLVLLTLAVASGGSLPLILHQLTCHSEVEVHGSAQEAPSESAASQCGHLCSHSSSSRSNSESDQRNGGNCSSTHDDCSICYQLSQLSVTFSLAELTESELVCFGSPSYVDSLDLSAVDCPYPSRGPPAT